MGTGVGLGGEVFTQFEQGLDIQFGSEDGFAVLGSGDGFAMRVEEGGLAEVAVVGITAGAVEAETVGLVFDGAGLEKRLPVGGADGGPVGDVDEQLGAATGGQAENFGEAQVVANEGGDGELAEGEGDDLVAGSEGAGFAAGGEGMDFGVVDDHLAVGIEDEGVVLQAIVGSLDGKAGEDVGVADQGQVLEEGMRGAGGVFGGNVSVEAKTGVKHFGQDDEIVGADGDGVEQGADFGVVSSLVFPGDVVLEGDDFHGLFFPVAYGEFYKITVSRSWVCRYRRW